MSVVDDLWGRLDQLPAERREAWLAEREAAISRGRRLLYLPTYFVPHPKQELFLSLSCLDAFFGGAAGGGKSACLLAAALQYVDVPDYAALILRRTYSDLALPGALMDMAMDWLGSTGAHWSTGAHTWTFPSGATVTFGHLEHEETKRRYASAEFQFVAFDELTHFTESQFTFLFSRLRRPAQPRGGESPSGLTIDRVPLRMRAASNPGGRGHDWVRARYIDAERAPGRVFVPSYLHENPGLDVAEYLKSLAELTEIERERLLEGDWEAVEEGGMFAPDSWPVLGVFDGDQKLRVWDLASTPESAGSTDPDWTVGLRFERDARTGLSCVTDVVRFRATPAETEARVSATADHDGDQVPVVIHEDPGAAGKAVVSSYSRHVLRGKAPVHGYRETGDKVTRAMLVSAAAERGEVACLRKPWQRALYSELRRFPLASHDDQVDALSTAYKMIGRLNARARSSAPTGRIDSRRP